MQDLEQYCLTFVRTHDYVRYLSLLYAPKQRRAALAALYAFNIELAKIAAQVSDPRMGQIRLQWWCDILSSSTTKTAASPLSLALTCTIEQYQLPRDHLIRACEAHVFDLYNEAMVTNQELENYCRHTTSTFIELACLILQSDQSSLSQPTCATDHAGLAQALCALIRAMPFLKGKATNFLPQELLAILAIKRETLLEKESQHHQDLAAQAIIALACEHYTSFLRTYAQIPKSCLSAYLPLAIVPAYLNKFAHAEHRIFAQRSVLSPLKRHWLIVKTALSGHFPPIKRKL